jgi:hypothetical protein
MSTSSVNVSFMSTFSVTVVAGNFAFKLHNSDRFINLAGVTVLNWAALDSHGLLGQTWRAPVVRDEDVREVEGRIDDYAEQNNDLFGDKFLFRV